MAQGLFVLDVDRCTGCSACVVACRNENPVAQDLSWREVQTYNRQRLPSAPVFHYSLSCNHCLEPACMRGCPANAYSKDPTTGAVLIDPAHCFGCRYCSWLCPYDAPRISNQSRIMEKCTFCNHRQEEGLEPACVVACPTDALRFEAASEPAVVHRPGFPETGLHPAIKVIGRRREAAPTAVATFDRPSLPQTGLHLDWSGLKNEWSLWLFSTVATILVAWFTSAATNGEDVVLALFASVGALSMAVSVLHLGRISRFWRAILNIRYSWVSREVFFFSIFFASACFAIMRPPPNWLLWTIAGFGFAALYSMDMVYRIPGQPVQTVPHSAMAILSAAFYIGILIASPVLLWPVAAVKAVLYLARPIYPPPGLAALAPLRLGVGLLIPCVLATAASPAVSGFAIWAAIFGELIDRGEFYASLRFLTPAEQIEIDLEE